MPKTPKISTKYDDVDETYQGSSSLNNLPLENSSRVTRSQNKPIFDESSQSEDASDSVVDSFDTANNSETNLSTTILELSSDSSESPKSSPSLSPSQQSSLTSSNSNMTLSEKQIKDLIEAQVNQRIQEYAEDHQAAAQPIEHTPRVSNIPQLSMTNYLDWAKKIRAALLLSQLWIDPLILPTDYNNTQKAKSKKAVQFIVMYLDACNNVHVTSENEDCFHTVWKKLKDFHKPNTSMTLCDFYCSLQHMIHRPNDCVRTHLMKIEQQFNKLTESVETADKLTENHKVAIVLASIRKSPEFSSLFNSAKWLKMESLTLSNVKDTIISAQDQLKMDSRATDDQAHASHHVPARQANQSKGKNFIRPHNRQPRDPVKGWNCTLCQMDNHTNATCNRNKPRKQTQTFNQSQSKDSQQSHLVFERQEENAHVNTANFGCYTIQNNAHKSRDRLETHQSSVKARLGNQRTASPYHNIKPVRRSQSELNADDDIDLSMLEFNDSHDMYDDDNLNQSSAFGNKRKFHKQKSKSFSFTQINECQKSNKELSHQSGINTHTIEIKSDSNPSSNFMNYKFSCFNTSLSQQCNKNMNSKQISNWILDSGASIHMCNDSSFLENFSSHRGQFVTVSNGVSIPITGFGDLQFNILDLNNVSHTILLKKVAFVPQLTVNLLSVRNLTKFGDVVFNKDSCIMLKPHKIKLGSLMNSTYVLEITHNSVVQKINNTSFACIHEWHRKLSHRNLDQIKRVKDVLNLSVSKCSCSDDCLSCIQSKICVQTFPKQSRKPDFPRELITSDLCGSFNTESIGGSKYFMTFTCAATDFTEVVTLRNKSDCKQEVINFMEKCFTQFGNYPKVFRTDRGGEYLDSELQNYLKSKGIQPQCTVANSPQQNGISERKNRTLVEAVRTLLVEKKLPHFLWAEALYHACFTFNCIPKINETKSPREKFFNKSSNISFIEFGSPVIFKMNAQNMSKLKPKGEFGIFVGFDQNSKGYRIYANHKIQIRRNVKFIDHPEKQKEVLPSSSQENIVEEQQTLRRSERIQQQKSLLTQTHFEPRTYKQAIKCPDRQHWLNAMKEELESIKANNTWSKVDLPKDRKAIGSRWIFKLKCNENGEVERYKARLVAQGFTQVYGTDYDEVFAPVARPTSFRVLLTIAGKQNLNVMQYDVKTAFLNGTIEEEIYLKPPQGFQSETKVFRLHKSLYGLKQSARKWNEAIHDCLTKINFTQSKHDSCLYVCHFQDDICYLIIHVDDILLAAHNIETITTLTSQISQSFELKCLGKAKQFLGININRRNDGLFEINQSSYINKIATTLQLEDSKGSLYPIDPGYFKLSGLDLENNTEFRKIIGMLLYISTNSRPDISASVGILSQRVAKPRDIDLKESLRIVKYLLKTKNHSLIFGDHRSQAPLQAFSDANWAEDQTDRKSTSGSLCQVFGAPVSWFSKKQDVVAISTTESEYYALTETIREVIWLKELLTDFKIFVKQPIPVFMDSQSCMKMVTNEKFSNRTKHIAVRYQFAKNHVHNNEIELKYVPTDENIADMLTKPLAGTKIRTLRELARLNDKDD
jgi:Reverse transcriptase (RNA-dependent DNA polymerase)/Integrase core domain/gag-polypeptide of LTR copia-type